MSGVGSTSAMPFTRTDDRLAGAADDRLRIRPEFDDRLHAERGVAIDVHVRVVARAKSILAGTKRILLLSTLMTGMSMRSARRSEIRERGASEARDAGVGERSYCGRNYPIAPTAGKRHAPACSASCTAPACNR